MRTYDYVGPKELLRLVGGASDRRRIWSQADLLAWAKASSSQPFTEREIVATFIVDTTGNLWVADRHSEHVVCAAGGPVLSDGELTFRISGEQVEVAAVTNQSTGFCPEPESWASVSHALDTAGIPHPDDFITRFQFRLCTQCHSINVVKENWFVCSICDAELTLDWNFGV